MADRMRNSKCVQLSMDEYLYSFQMQKSFYIHKQTKMLKINSIQMKSKA